MTRNKAHQNQGANTANQRYMRARPQDYSAKILSCEISRKVYEIVEALQNDLSTWIDHYNNERTHQGERCRGRTPYETMKYGKEIWKTKFINRT